MMIATAESQTRDVYTSLLKQIKTDKSLKRNQWRLPCWIKYTSQSCWVYVPDNYCKRLNFVIYVSFFAKFNYLISIINVLFMTLFKCRFFVAYAVECVRFLVIHFRVIARVKRHGGYTDIAYFAGFQV